MLSAIQEHIVITCLVLLLYLTYVNARRLQLQFVFKQVGDRKLHILQTRRGQWGKWVDVPSPHAKET